MMRKQELIHALAAFVRDQLLDGKDEGLDENTPLLEWGIIDSMAMVGLLAFIDEQFGIQVPDLEVTPENFQSLGMLASLLERLPVRPDGGQAESGPLRKLEARGIERVRVELGADGVQHALRTQGQGPTWVLLPALGHHASSWEGVLLTIQGDQRALAIDLGGLGYSAAPGGTLTLEDHVRRTLGVLERVERSPVVLVGNSAGGLIAAEIARRRPEWVRALVLVGVGHVADGRRWWRNFRELARTPDRFIERAYQQPSRLTASARAALEQTLSSVALASFLDDTSAAALSTALDGVRVPTMFVTGEEDRLVSRAAVLAAAQRIPGARVEWLARCGHFPPIERPEELVLYLNAFAGDRRAAQLLQEVA